ncbi:13550_t:CDS:2, partial [Funneliformis mosseae]
MLSIVINEEDIIYKEDLNMETTLDLEEDTEIYITKQITIKTVLHLLTPIEYLPISKDEVDRTCHELKICEFASPKLQEIEQESVDSDSDLCLKVNEELLSNNIENNTFACDRWNFNEKFYWYISIKENNDLNLLQQLLSGLYEGKTDKLVNNCFIVLSNNSKKKLSHPHCERNTIKRGSIIQKSCNVKFSKLIPINLEKCPFVILISQGVHSHPPPLPNH